MRSLEMCVCFEIGTWTTVFVEINSDTPEDEVETAGRNCVDGMGLIGDIGSFLYNSMDDEIPE